MHCRLGVSRSVSAIIAFLIAVRGMPLQAAWQAVRTARPEANPHPCYARQLEVLDCCVHGTAAPSIPLRSVLLEESRPEMGGAGTGDRGSERSGATSSSSSRQYQQQRGAGSYEGGGTGSSSRGRIGESRLARRERGGGRRGGGLRAARSRAKEQLQLQHASEAADNPYDHSSHGHGGPGTTSSSDGVDSGFASTGGSQYAGGGGVSMAALNGSIGGGPSPATRWGGSASAGSPYGGPPGDDEAVGSGSLGTRRGPYRGKGGRSRGGRRGGGRGSGRRSGSGSAPDAVP